MLKRLNRPSRCHGLLSLTNSFRRSAKEKSTEMKAVDEQLNQKLQDLKNSE